MMIWDSLSGVPVMSRSLFVQGIYPGIGKRLFDLGVSLMLLPIAATLIFVICAIMAFYGPTGLYAHARVGQNGKIFRCWKIQTMIPQADQALIRLCEGDPSRQAEWTQHRKLSDDPRILPLGRFLRRVSLDELPQIWNVVRGDMSLVGPRPVTREELTLYGDVLPDYLKLRPGITGLWQVTSRRTGSYDQRVALDQRYAKNLNLRDDLWILAKTLPVVLRPTGR